MSAATITNGYKSELVEDLVDDFDHETDSAETAVNRWCEDVFSGQVEGGEDKEDDIEFINQSEKYWE